MSAWTIRCLVALALVALLLPLGTPVGAQEVAPSLALTLVPNRVRFHPGDTLTVTILVDNPGLAATADFYFGARLPDGATVVHFTDLSFRSAVGSLADLRSIVPLAAGIALAGPFTFEQAPFFQFTWTGTEPMGPYLLFLAAAPPGGLAAGPLLGLATAEITVGPPMSVLPGAPDALASTALFALDPQPADPGDIVDGVILTKLDVVLAPDATVGQVNAALALIGGRIVSMSAELPSLTIGVPRQTDATALEGLAATLEAAPGILLAAPAHEAALRDLPAPGVLADLDHLLPTRFPAAWHAKRLAREGCGTTKARVPIVVPDNFTSPTPREIRLSFALEVPFTQFTLTGPGTGTSRHGYDVVTVLAAMFNEQNPTGANPFIECLDIRAVQLGGLSEQEIIRATKGALPPAPTRFILSNSAAFGDKCVPASCASTTAVRPITPPLVRANVALAWKVATLARRGDFLAVSAAGNEADEVGTLIYPGLGKAVYDSWHNLVTEADALFDFAANSALWAPQGGAAAPDLRATPAQMAGLRALVTRLGLDTVGPAPNVLIVGSTTASPDLLVGSLQPSPSSDQDPNVWAVGESVFGLQGTSFAAPQVAGLASYLWLLSPDLRGRSDTVALTRQAIFDNTRPAQGVAMRVIDAYAAALSLDANQLPTVANAPVRLAILDVNDDGVFNAADAQLCLAAYDAAGAGGTRNYDRCDLNGDGFTGGAGTERFDLDRVGSTQFGATVYGVATQTIEGMTVSFNKSALTDFRILCYYAYSGLFQGTASARTSVLGDRCGSATSPPPPPPPPPVDDCPCGSARDCNPPPGC